MFRPLLNSLMLGSLVFPFFATAESNAQGGVIHFYGQIVEPACDVMQTPVEMTCMQNSPVQSKTYSSKELMSGKVKNAQIASVKVQYLDEQKKLAVMNIEYN
ncbi:type 1 fimbrial protein [Escherichia coli]|uniref:type 1 fimbrial protein n=1 Tax=Escherichia coli TaxID=562 RepID=UPI003CE81989